MRCTTAKNNTDDSLSASTKHVLESAKPKIAIVSPYLQVVLRWGKIPNIWHFPPAANFGGLPYIFQGLKPNETQHLVE